MSLNFKKNKNIVQNLSSYFKKKIQAFYVSESYLMFNSYDRPFELSVFYIIFRQYEILQFNFNKDSYTHFLNNNQNTNNYIEALIMEQWSTAKVSLFLSGKKIKHYKLASFLLRAYPYINFIASVYASLCMFSIQMELSIINLILTIQLCTTDFDIRYTIKDFLAKKNAKHDYIFNILQVVAIFILKYGNYVSLPYIGLCYNIIKLIYQFLYHPYQDFQIQTIEFSLTFTNVCISFVFMVGQFNSSSIDFIFTLLTCIPLGYTAGSVILSYQLKKRIARALSIINTKKGVEKTSQQLELIDLFMRFLANNLNCTLTQYIESPHSIILEKLVVEHHLNCQEYPNCFCKKYVILKQQQFLLFINQLLKIIKQEEEITRTDFIGETIRKQYLEYFIRNTYLQESKLQRHRINDFLFSYYAFMINWTKNQTTSFREILSLREKVIKKVTLKQKMLIKYVFELASEQFELEAQRIYQKTHGQLIDIIIFDENLEDASALYRQCLKEKQELLLIMSKDFINLEQMEKQALKLQEKRTRLQDDLVKLFQVNSTSLSLLSLCEGFEDCLTIEPLFRRMYMHQVKTGQKKNRIPYYYDDSVAIYISLLNDIGKIVKVSKNFSQVVPLVKTNSDAIGRNINFIMNDEIAHVHDAILLHCVQKKLLQQDVKHYPLVLGINSQGWAVVYSFKVQICMLGNKELGACGWLKQVNDGNIYIMTSSITDNYRFFLQDQKFFNIIFRHSFTQGDAKKIRLGNLMPIMKHLGKKGSNGSVYETIIIRPTNLKDAMSERDIYDSSLISDLIHLNLYSIRFSYYAINGQFVQFVEFQIYHLKPLHDIHSKREALKNFRLQIQEYADAEVIKKKLVEQQNMLTEIKENNNLMSLDSLGLNSLVDDHQSRTLIDAKGRKQSLLLFTPKNFQQEQSLLMNAKNMKSQFEEKTNFREYEQQYQQDTTRENQSLNDSSQNQRRGIQDEEEIKKSQNGYNKSDIQIANQLVNVGNGNYQINSASSLNNIPESNQSYRFQIGNKDLKLLQNIQYNDVQQIQQENIVSQNNVMSQDSTYFSPASSQRKALLFFPPDTQRQNQTDMIVHDTAIQEDSIEEDIVDKEDQNNRFKSQKYAQKKNKSVNIVDNKVEVLKNSEEVILSSGDPVKSQEDGDKMSSELSNQVEDEFQDDNNVFKDDREKDSSVKTGKTSKSSVRQS